MIEAIRSNPSIIGYCVHALTAGDWVIGAGLLDLWRNPKGEAYYKTKEANQEKLIVIRTDKRNYYKNENITLNFIGINENKSENINLDIKIYKGKRIVYKKNQTKILIKGVIDLFEISFDNFGSGNYKIIADILDNKKNIINSSSSSFSVFNELKSKKS